MKETATGILPPFRRLLQYTALCALALAASTIAALPQSPEERAWDVLHAGLIEKSTDNRAAAARALGLIVGNAKAASLAQNVLIDDEKPEVRAAGAAALGQIKEKSAIPDLKTALDDKDVGVALAAAESLLAMGDQMGYDVFYSVLTGERKTGGLISEQLKILHEPKKMIWLGLQEGIGFVPFGGIGYSAYQALSKDTTSQVRAASAKTLAKDPDPRTAKALVRATSDKSWVVRAAALGAIALRDDASLLPQIEPKLADEKPPVRYTAAAAIIRLSATKKTIASGK